MKFYSKQFKGIMVFFYFIAKLLEN